MAVTMLVMMLPDTGTVMIVLVVMTTRLVVMRKLMTKTRTSKLMTMGAIIMMVRMIKWIIETIMATMRMIRILG